MQSMRHRQLAGKMNPNNSWQQNRGVAKGDILEEAQVSQAEMRD